MPRQMKRLLAERLLAMRLAEMRLTEVMTIMKTDVRAAHSGFLRSGGALA